MPSGAKITTHLKALAKMKLPKRRELQACPGVNHGKHIGQIGDHAGDRDAGRHVVVDAQHVGAEPLVDHAGFGAADGRALRVSSV